MSCNIIAIILFLLHFSTKVRAQIKCDPQKIQMPNPADPYTFYKCAADGVAVLFHCPAGLMYDTKLAVCNWPSEVTGTSGGGNTHITGSGGSTTTGGGIPAGTGTGEGNTADAGGSNQENGQENNTGSLGMDCSVDAGGAPKMYQNPEDCSTYYTCNMGRPVLTYCTRGLFFNPDINGCDNTVPEGCQLVDPDKPGGGAIWEEQRKLRLKMKNRKQ